MIPKKSLDFYCPRCERKTRYDFVPQTNFIPNFPPANTPNYFLYQCTNGCDAIIPLSPQKYETLLENLKIQKENEPSITI